MGFGASSENKHERVSRYYRNMHRGDVKRIAVGPLLNCRMGPFKLNASEEFYKHAL